MTFLLEEHMVEFVPRASTRALRVLAAVELVAYQVEQQPEAAAALLRHLPHASIEDWFRFRHMLIRAN
jgi:hypothetical protein